MKGFRRLTSGELAALLTVLGVGAALYAYGDHIFSPGPLNAESRRKAPQGGVSSHAELGRNCAACHVPPWSGETMAGRCLACHTNVRQQLDARGPLHGQIPNGSQCRDCHTEHHGPKAAMTNLASFDHNWTAFKLSGKHLTVDCYACHVNHVYQGTAQACVACHAEPQKHLGRFGSDCAQCHSTTTWASTGLTNFNHDLTAFKLTGKHRTVDCRSCHVNNVFKGTSTACVSCHPEPAVPLVHKSRYGTTCSQCHSTTAWTGAVFQHNAFPITHGRRNNTCATCHQDSSNFVLYTCYNCHEHTPAKEERRHARMAKIQQGLVKLENCLECHGRRRGIRAAADLDGEETVEACRWANGAGHPTLGPGLLTESPDLTKEIQWLLTGNRR